MEQARRVIENVDYAESAYGAIEGADAVVIVTEWDAFRALDLKRVKSLLKSPVFVDLRNIYPVDEVTRAGLEYTSIGRSWTLRKRWEERRVGQEWVSTG